MTAFDDLSRARLPVALAPSHGDRLDPEPPGWLGGLARRGADAFLDGHVLRVRHPRRPAGAPT